MLRNLLCTVGNGVKPFGYLAHFFSLVRPFVLLKVATSILFWRLVKPPAVHIIVQWLFLFRQGTNGWNIVSVQVVILILKEKH